MFYKIKTLETKNSVLKGFVSSYVVFIIFIMSLKCFSNERSQGG